MKNAPSAKLRFCTVMEKLKMAGATSAKIGQSAMLMNVGSGITSIMKNDHTQSA